MKEDPAGKFIKKKKKTLREWISNSWNGLNFSLECHNFLPWKLDHNVRLALRPAPYSMHEFESKRKLFKYRNSQWDLLTI